MSVTVVYKSKYAQQKTYAERLVEELGCEAIDEKVEYAKQKNI